MRTNPTGDFDSETIIRCTAEQVRAWRIAATADARTLSSWVRHVLDLAAEENSKKSTKGT